MRIISAKFLVASLLAGASPLAASDMFYQPEKMASLGSFKLCLADLQQRQRDAKIDAGTKVVDSGTAVGTSTVAVSEVQLTAPKKAEFTISSNYRTEFKPGVEGTGGMYASQRRFYCVGRLMWKDGGHSAWVPIPAKPVSIPAPKAQ